MAPAGRRTSRPGARSSGARRRRDVVVGARALDHLTRCAVQVAAAARPAGRGRHW
ncbi:MAG: hypothetical protein AVDCRST_MAG16-3060 [uncultured Frankineae bacterium]|uniref:Uncharacterized protein n=1 Tax=uncultured Frankineae bacterium TaxID=437475 RepID=A0A6J4ML33_9ACTN|nr:MAG: hypothetical protein AVDCRST_MAG16-3060 [uncultured Frankineae bacterium]